MDNGPEECEFSCIDLVEFDMISQQTMQRCLSLSNIRFRQSQKKNVKSNINNLARHLTIISRK